MTITEAKATIYANVVYACEKAGFPLETTQLVQEACDTIIALANACETIITLADRKTENCSEKPNDCKVKNYCDDCLYTDTCDSKEFFCSCTSKATISKMEQVQTMDSYSYARGFADGRESMRNLFERDEPQNYCKTCKWWNDTVVGGSECVSKECVYQPKDEHRRKGVENEQTCYPTEKRERTDHIL